MNSPEIVLVEIGVPADEISDPGAIIVTIIIIIHIQSGHKLEGHMFPSTMHFDLQRNTLKEVMSLSRA